MYDEKYVMNEQFRKNTYKSPSKTLPNLVRNASVFDEVKKNLGEEGNVGFNETFPPIISCKTGEKYIDPNVMVIQTHVKKSSQEWYDKQMELYNKNKTNGITACKYYVSIILDQSKKKIGDYRESKKTVNYDEEILDCINGSYMKDNFLPDGCVKRFQQYREGVGMDIVRWSTGNWWFSDYQKWTSDKNYTPKSPITMNSYYSIRKAGEGKDSQFDIENNLGKEDGMKAIGLYSIDYDTDVTANLALTKEEMQTLTMNPMTSDNKFKGGGKYICKKPNVTMVNVRTSPEVNTDTGTFDPYDNYINWTSDDIIGKYIGEKRQSFPIIAQNQVPTSLETFSKKLTKNEIFSWRDLIDKKMSDTGKVGIYKKTILDFFDKKKLDNNFEYAKLQGIIIIMKVYGLDTNNKSFIPQEIYAKLPSGFKPMLWYNIELMKPMEDKSEYTTDIYKKAWVRSDNVVFCKTGDDENSQTTYTMEKLKRLPMKPLKDM